MAENVKLALHPERPPPPPGANGAGEHAGPTRELVERAGRIVRVSDARGRVLGLKAPGLLDRLRLLELVGPANAENYRYVSIVAAIYAVVELDGERLAPPATKRELEARASLLDEDGFDAAARAMVEHFRPPSAAEVEETLKKIPGAPT